MILEELRLEIGKLILSKQIYLPYFLISHSVEVNFTRFSFFEELVKRHRVGSGPKTILDIDLVEEGYHVLSLIFRRVEMFNPIENSHNYDLVRHDARLLKKFFVTLLDPLYRGL